MIRSILVLPISPLPHYGIQSNLISTESYIREESNGIGCKEFGSELVEDVGYYQSINNSSLIRIISAF